jgi:hypothetical protein
MAVDIGVYSTRLNPKMALKMAQVSKHVYHSKPNGAPDDYAILSGLKLLDSDFKSVSGTSKNSAQAILVEHERFLCMAFRGTDEWEDWLDNIDGRQSNSEQAMFGDFHRGFHRSCNDVWEFLDNGYKALRDKDREEGTHRPLFLTGHSLGGAMATVAAAKLVLEDRAFSSVYTYGQPRVVKRETAQFMSNECGAKYFRFQNNEDLVTRVPARLMGYSHVGSCLYIDVDGAIHTDVGFWYRFLDVISGALDACKDLITKGGGTSLIGDHHIDRYIEKIERWDFMKD